MDRRHLEYFVTVAEVGSFTGAAQALSIAQPSLSHAIGGLERDLGTRLFERNGRGVSLTPSGEALLEPARRALRSFQLARSAVRAVSEGGFGRISMITNTLWAVSPLADLIGGFRTLHPKVQVTVADPVRRNEVLDAVRLGGAELGLLDGRPPSGILASMWLADHELVAVLPARWGPVPTTVSIADLVPVGLICTPEGTALRAFVDDLLEARGLPPDVAVETAHLATVVPLVLAGAGAAVLPRGLAANAAAKGARVVSLAPQARSAVHLVWRDGRLSPLAQHFVDFAADGLRGAIGDASHADSRSV